MYKISYTNHMKKDIKLMKKRGKNLQKLSNVLTMLSTGKPLPFQFKDHQLSGKFCNLRECHIEPDWLLLYQISNDMLIPSATATGSHSDIFGW